MTVQRYGVTRGTAAAWVAANDTYEAGVDGYETDTGFRKTFDGTTSWNSLYYNHPWPYVRAASTANVTIASGIANGSTLDGVTLATGDRVLLKNQSTGSQNGTYIVPASGAASRDMFRIYPNTMWLVAEGTTNADTAWWVTTNGTITIGSTSLTIAQFGAGGGSAAWGSITGTLSSQTDLNTALGLKAPLASPTFTGTFTAPTGLTGIGKLASGVLSAVTAPSGAIVGDTDTQTLTHKDLTAGTNTFPTLNQDSTGKSAKTDALNSATTVVNVAAATAPSGGQVLKATDSTHATWQTLAESDITNLTTDLAAKQPLDSDLTTIAGLTATTDNFLVSVSSAWASRTPAQVKTTLAIAESDVTSLVSDLAAKASARVPDIHRHGHASDWPDGSHQDRLGRRLGRHRGHRLLDPDRHRDLHQQASDAAHRDDDIGRHSDDQHGQRGPVQHHRAGREHHQHDDEPLWFSDGRSEVHAPLQGQRHAPDDLMGRVVRLVRRRHAAPDNGDQQDAPSRARLGRRCVAVDLRRR